MKKLQIMAGMLSVLLLAGCGGAGASAKTTEGDPPQVASAAASGTVSYTHLDVYKRQWESWSRLSARILRSTTC